MARTADIPGGRPLIHERFAVEKEASRGGMGVVYRALDRVTGQTVALKVLRRAVSTPSEEERFHREAQILSTLRHPAIVSYVTHGITKAGEHYMAMEWLEGETLALRLSRGLLTPRQALALLSQISSGLAEAHRAGIVHRDIKPHNILLRGAMLSKATMIDFGVARGGLLPVLTKTGFIVGTPEYMSPEQARGQRNLSPASDVFSLGCLFYACVTGSTPFAADQVPGVLAKILFDEPPRLGSLLKAIPQALEDLLRDMLAKEPTQRIADAAELLKRLDALADVGDASANDSTVEVVAHPSSLSALEQILLGVIVARSPLFSGHQDTVEAPLDNDDLAGFDLQGEQEQRQRVQDAITQIGGRPEWLLDGTMVVTVTGPHGGFATDLVIHSARVAQRLAELLAPADVALAIGSSEVELGIPIGKTIDQALGLLPLLEGLAPMRLPDARTGAEASGSVWVDGLSRELLYGRAELSEPSPTGATRLLRLLPEQDSARPLLGRAAPCLGRESDLIGLQNSLQVCLDEGWACAVTIIAPPGLGKSRLRQEFVHRVQGQQPQLTVLSVSCDAQRASTSYGLLRQLLRKLLTISDSDAPDVRRRKLRAAPYLPWPRAGQPDLTPLLGELAGIAMSEGEARAPDVAGRDPAQLGDLMVRAWLDYLGSRTTQLPLLLVIDDLQWGDALSVKLLERTLRTLHDRPIMIVGFGRPEVEERFPNLWSGLAQRIRLASLNRKASERLVYHALGNQTEPAVVAQIVKLADGNPLFLEELIRAHASTGSAQQPSTVIAMLQSRIGRLPTSQRLILRAGAIIGNGFSVPVLHTLLGPTGALLDLDRDLTELVDSEILSRREGGPDGAGATYTFQQALMREAAYNLLTAADRATGHRLLAELYSNWPTSNSDTVQPGSTPRDGRVDAMMVAEHWQRAGEPLQAVPHLVQAAEQAFADNDVAETERRAKLALSCGAEGEAQGRLRGLLAWVAHLHADFGLVEELGTPAMAYLTAGSERWSVLRSALATAALFRGRPADAVAQTRELLTTTPAAGAQDKYIEALAQMLATFARTQLRSLSDQLLARLQQVLGSDTPAASRSAAAAFVAQSVYLRHFGPQPTRQAAMLEQAIAMLQRWPAPHWLVLAEGQMGEVRVSLGQLEEGLNHLRTATERSEGLGNPLLSGLVHLQLAEALIVRGERVDMVEAEQMLDATWREQQSEKPVLWAMPGHIQALQADAALRCSEWARAALLARAALQPLPLPSLLALGAQVTLTRALLAQGQTADAQEMARALQEHLVCLGDVGLRAVDARVARAEVLHASGHQAAAVAELERALLPLHSAAAQLPSAEACALFLSAVPTHARATQLRDAWRTPAPTA